MVARNQLDVSKVNRSQVARDTGTDLAHISRIFNLGHPESVPSLFLAMRIAKSLGVSVDELLGALGITLPDESGSEVTVTDPV